MNWLKKMFRGSPDSKNTGAEGTKTVSAQEYIRKTPPGSTPLHDLCQILSVWMNSAPAVSDQEKLRKLLDYYGQSWLVDWKTGTRDDVYGWFEKCATVDARSQSQSDVRGLELSYQKYGEIVIETTPDFWIEYGVVGSVIQIGVCGSHHVIGKISGEQFLYLAHQ